MALEKIDLDAQQVLLCELTSALQVAAASRLEDLSMVALVAHAILGGETALPELAPQLAASRAANQLIHLADERIAGGVRERTVEAHFRMTHIPFTGARPAVVALLSEQVDALATGPSTVVQHIKSGKLRALAHWGDHPVQSLPGVPILAELGYPTAQFAQWSALFVPAGASDAVVLRLREASRKIDSDHALQQTIERSGSPVAYLDTPQFHAYWDKDASVMTEAVRHIGKLE